MPSAPAHVPIPRSTCCRIFWHRSTQLRASPLPRDTPHRHCCMQTQSQQDVHRVATAGAISLCKPEWLHNVHISEEVQHTAEHRQTLHIVQRRHRANVAIGAFEALCIWPWLDVSIDRLALAAVSTTGRPIPECASTLAMDGRAAYKTLSGQACAAAILPDTCTARLEADAGAGAGQTPKLQSAPCCRTSVYCIPSQATYA